MKSNFTYLYDIIEVIFRLHNIILQADTDWAAEGDSTATRSLPYRVYNIGDSYPIELLDYITALEEAPGIEAEKNIMPFQAEDVLKTSADTKAQKNMIGIKTEKSVKKSVIAFVELYKK